MPHTQYRSEWILRVVTLLMWGWGIKLFLAQCECNWRNRAVFFHQHRFTPVFSYSTVHTYSQLKNKVGHYMNTLQKTNESQSMHYWMLWVSPTPQQTKEIRNLPETQRSKVLMLHPKDLNKLQGTLNIAISSGLYQSITMEKILLSQHQRHQIQALAARHNTVITWLSTKPSLNSASQLSLIY